jgi:hypothetical protein
VILTLFGEKTAGFRVSRKFSEKSLQMSNFTCQATRSMSNLGRNRHQLRISGIGLSLIWTVFWGDLDHARKIALRLSGLDNSFRLLIGGGRHAL